MSHADVPDLMCRELVELVSDYLGQSLSADEQARFERHLLDCPPCTEYVSQMRATIALARGLSAGSTEAVTPTLLAVFRSWHKK